MYNLENILCNIELGEHEIKQRKYYIEYGSVNIEYEMTWIVECKMQNEENRTRNIEDERYKMDDLRCNIECGIQNMFHVTWDIEQSSIDTKWFSAAGEEVVPTHNTTNNKRCSRKCTKGALGLIGQKRRF